VLDQAAASRGDVASVPPLFHQVGHVLLGNALLEFLDFGVDRILELLRFDLGGVVMADCSAFSASDCRFLPP